MSSRSKQVLRAVVGSREFFDSYRQGTSVTLTKRWRLTLDCGHRVTRDDRKLRAKCPKGCVAVLGSLRGGQVEP